MWGGVGYSGYKALKINGLGDEMTDTASTKHTKKELHTLGFFRPDLGPAVVAIQKSRFYATK